MSQIAHQLDLIQSRIRSALLSAGRSEDSLRLVAVSKTFPAESIRDAYAAGQRHFGESRLQEALPKIEMLPSDICWHFIGRVQRNKLRKIIEAFDVIHGIDSLALAQHAERIASEIGLFPKIFLQVNVAGEESKGGFTPQEIAECITEIMELPRLEVLGLMAIPPPAKSSEEARHWFAEVAKLRDQLQVSQNIRLDDLSMGMSDDFEAAIAEGATYIRIGSAIFGNR